MKSGHDPKKETGLIFELSIVGTCENLWLFYILSGLKVIKNTQKPSFPGIQRFLHQLVLVEELEVCGGREWGHDPNEAPAAARMSRRFFRSFPTSISVIRLGEWHQELEALYSQFPHQQVLWQAESPIFFSAMAEHAAAVAAGGCFLPTPHSACKISKKIFEQG